MQGMMLTVTCLGWMVPVAGHAAVQSPCAKLPAPPHNLGQAPHETPTAVSDMPEGQAMRAWQRCTHRPAGNERHPDRQAQHFQGALLPEAVHQGRCPPVIAHCCPQGPACNQVLSTSETQLCVIAFVWVTMKLKLKDAQYDTAWITCSVEGSFSNAMMLAPHGQTRFGWRVCAGLFAAARRMGLWA